ncbi:BTB/POZ and MATH domain-containing protein 2-like [Lolium perenne]|uniref:BTB/POZ and MATH domain-containing protein 2-like n=1 Tax=Lolium perenne TaxID=4522 RepID=UPI003A99B395
MGFLSAHITAVFSPFISGPYWRRRWFETPPYRRFQKVRLLGASPLQSPSPSSSPSPLPAVVEAHSPDTPARVPSSLSTARPSTELAALPRPSTDALSLDLVMSFAGVSVITDGKHCTTSAVDTGTDSGYHLLVVKDYSRTVQEIPNGEMISSGPFMVYDCFTIRWDVMVCKDPSTQDVGATISDIGQHLDYLLQSKVGADVTFEVSGETIPAHRCVLAGRSTVFMALLFGPMKEGTTSSVIQIKDMEAKVFKDLLSFIYTGSCQDLEDGKEEEDVEYVMWLHDLFVVADRYDLPRLKLLCEEHLSEHIGVSSVASTLALAEQHHCHKLRETCLKFIQVQSPPCLEKVMATDGWEHITTAYPSVLNELTAKLASNQKDKKRKR